MNKFFYFAFLTTVFLVSCSDLDVSESYGEERGREFFSRKESDINSMLSFSTRQSLSDAIGGSVDREAVLLKQLPTTRFVSLLDEVEHDDPALDTLSQEEKDYVLNNRLSYYEAFGYEDLVPNEDFAALLSKNGEIMVNDTVYRVTNLGTLSASAVNYKDMSEVDDSLHKAMFQFGKGELKRQFSKGVTLYNTFGEVSQVDKMNIEGAWRPNTPNTDLNEEKTSPVSNTPLENIPFSTFPVFDTASHSIFAPIGKLLGLGERSTKHHEYAKGKRVNGSLYCYNYYVYHEAGVYVSMSQKRGGFFRFINGWKKVVADEMVINLENVVFQIKINLPNDVKAMMEKTNKVYGYSANNHFSNKGKVVNILSYDFKEEDVYKLIGSGVKEALKMLERKTNSSIDPQTRVAQIITPNRIYVVILQDPIYVKNRAKYRKVFNPGIFIGGSLEVIQDPLNIRSWKNLLDLYKSVPKLVLVEGQANIAGRREGQWGGMKIVKKKK